MSSEDDPMVWRSENWFDYEGRTEQLINDCSRDRVYSLWIAFAFFVGSAVALAYGAIVTAMVLFGCYQLFLIFAHESSREASSIRANRPLVLLINQQFKNLEYLRSNVNQLRRELKLPSQ